MRRKAVITVTSDGRSHFAVAPSRPGVTGQRPVPESKAGAAGAGPVHVRLMVIAFAITGFGLRAGVTSVGSVLNNIQHSLNANGFVVGVLTTLPVLCFAAMGASAPWLATKVGLHRSLVLALAVSVVGFVSRAFAPNIGAFLVLSVVTLAGAAVANVMLPSLVKLHFAERVGHMTAIYATCLSIGTSISAGLTVPIGHVGGSWRVGLGIWAIFPALAILPWLSTVRRESRPTSRTSTEPRKRGRRDLVRSPTAWTLTLFFGAMCAIAYIGFGWMAHFMTAHGISQATAGAMVAVMTAVSIPGAMLIPRVPHPRHRTVIIALCSCFAAAFVGLGVAPAGGAWVWMVLFGMGTGLFPLSLTMIGMRARNHETTHATSAFVQSIGYLIAGAGPLLFGALYSATHGWSAPLAMLWVALIITAITGWLAARPRFVDDEITTAERPIEVAQRS
jgi:MFS transporter, CP family, cyanate transporter